MVYLAAKIGVKCQLSGFQPALEIFIAFLRKQSTVWGIAGKLYLDSNASRV
jgi:hypothetical protein